MQRPKIVNLCDESRNILFAVDENGNTWMLITDAMRPWRWRLAVDNGREREGGEDAR